MRRRSLPLLLVIAAVSACAHGARPSSVAAVAGGGLRATGSAPARPATPATPTTQLAASQPSGVTPDCTACASSGLTPAEEAALERRLVELKARGGHCSSYAEVLERSYRGGRITIRPYMWRVGSRLTSGEAQPDGTMTLAREIDPLNVGLRTVVELVWSMEHEAAHIAFDLESARELGPGDRADDYVRECRRSDVANPGS